MFSSFSVVRLPSMGCVASTAKVAVATSPAVAVSPTVSTEDPELEILRGRLRSIGIPVGGRKTKQDLQALLAALEKPTPAPPLSASSSSSSSPSPATRRLQSFAETPVSVSPASSRIFLAWLGKARSNLRPPELPRLPPTGSLKTARVPTYLKMANVRGPTFMDALKDERQNLINTQTVKVQLSKALPDQAKPKTQLPAPLLISTPGFGKATPGFGQGDSQPGSGNQLVSGTPFELPAVPYFDEALDISATPQPTPRPTTPGNGDSPSGELFPSSPEAKSARGLPERAILVEGTHFTVGGFEFCAGETVEWGRKRGVVVGVSKDGQDVRVRHEGDGRLLKIPPDRLVRVELRIGRLFDIFNNSSAD